MLLERGAFFVLLIYVNNSFQTNNSNVIVLSLQKVHVIHVLFDEYTLKDKNAYFSDGTCNSRIKTRWILTPF